MADAPKIILTGDTKDTLLSGATKINQAIDNANEAKQAVANVGEAITNANTAAENANARIAELNGVDAAQFNDQLIQLSTDLAQKVTLQSDIKGTTQVVTTNVNGDVTKIQHTDSNNTVIREDVFDYSLENIIVETRTLIATGETITYKYHTDTLNTEVI